MRPEEQEALERFAGYVKAYDPSDKQIALKIKHTMRVVGYMKTICEQEEVSSALRRLGFFAALFHDIGRFEQVRRYHTFLDAKSVDHALLSRQICSKENFLSALNQKEQEQVLFAIRNHSAFVAPESEDTQAIELLRLLRDADKLDILRVFAREDSRAAWNGTLESAASSTVSDAVYESILRHECVKKSDRQTDLDIWCTFLGFFFDFNTGSAMQIAWQEKYFLEPFQAVEFINPETKQRVSTMLKLVEEAVKKQEVQV